VEYNSSLDTSLFDLEVFILVELHEVKMQIIGKI